MAKTDEITAILEGVDPPAANQHQNWLNRNLDVLAKFMGVPITGGVCRAMQPALRAAETNLLRLGTAATLGIRTVSGFQGNGFHGFHSWGLAIDINYVTNPYIMNESGEDVLDKQLRPVFDRICQLMVVNDPRHPEKSSIVPRLGQLRRNHQLQQAYDAIRAESEAMQRYFTLMQDGDALKQYLNSPNGYQGYKAAFGPDGVNPEPICKAPGQWTPVQLVTNSDALAVQHRMEADWTVLTSRFVPQVVPPNSKAVVCKQDDVIFERAPPLPTGDRPFDGPRGVGLLNGRSPLAGYLDMSAELVSALVNANLRWGATDFGAYSGDIMHFDCGNLGALTFPTGHTVADLKQAMSAWNRAHP
jgi:hypothetical protein